MAAVGAVKLEELLKWARKHARCDALCGSSEPARAVLALLEGNTPIGMEAPPIVSFGDGTCGLLVDDRSDPLDAAEARGWAATILRGADELDERNR